MVWETAASPTRWAKRARSSLSKVSKPKPLDTLLPEATPPCVRVRVRAARLP